FGDYVERHLLLKIPGYNRGRVVRVIVDVVERLEAQSRHAFDIRTPTDGRMMIRVLAECGSPDALVEDAARIVLAALQFIADHGHLQLPVLIGDERIAHAVGFDP